MLEKKLSVFGPWTKLFEGTMEEKKIELLVNDDFNFLSAIILNENKIIIQATEIIYSPEALQGLISSIKGEFLLIEKNEEKKQRMFIIVKSKVIKSNLKENALNSDIDNILKEVKAKRIALQGIARTNAVKLIELKEAERNIVGEFLSELNLLSVLFPKQGERSELKELRLEDKIIELGKNKGKIEAIDLKEVENIAIIGGNASERLHVMHVLIEGILLTGTSLIIFQKKNYFTGLTEASLKEKELADYKVCSSSLGFKVNPIKTTKFSFEKINAKGFIKSIKLGNSLIGKQMKKIMEEKKFNSLNELLEEIKIMETDYEFNEFQKRRLERIIELIKDNYSEIIKGKNNVMELFKTTKGYGKCYIVNQANQDFFGRLLQVKGLLNDLKEVIERENKINAFIFLPEESDLLAFENNNESITELIKITNNLRDFVRTVVSTKYALDLDQEFLKKAILFEIINKKDVVMTLPWKRPKRFKLRIGLSKCTGHEKQ